MLPDALPFGKTDAAGRRSIRKQRPVEKRFPTGLFAHPDQSRYSDNALALVSSQPQLISFWWLTA